MKNIFECEICGARFYEEKNCVAHETEHKTEQARKVEKEVKRKESVDNLKKLYNNYLDAFKKYQKEFGNPTCDLYDFWRNIF